MGTVKVHIRNRMANDMGDKHLKLILSSGCKRIAVALMWLYVS